MWFFRTMENFAKLIGFTNNPPTIAMKYYTLGSLHDFIADKLDLASFHNSISNCFLLRDVAVALREMHESGFVHCDIKPANILIDQTPERGVFAVLSDFGISRVLVTTVLLVQAFQVANNDGASVAYAAPEVLRRANKDESETINEDELKASDVYSYSMVAFELVTKQCPWPKSMHAIEVIKAVLRNERPKIPDSIQQSRIGDAILDGIMGVMEQCWSVNPMDRLQMKWVAEIFEQLTQGKERKECIKLE